ncbi:MAG TPA: antitoxin VapB family protein [Candidatus Limnocylindrales bacterium]|nr:antitoxin VapB family protein [Candidatus Limnocylindrales bacterium]
MVRVISISDEVYLELSRMKNGKSFTELLKELIDQCERKGDPQKILEFLDTHEALSDESAEKIMDEVKEGRKRSTPRKLS